MAPLTRQRADQPGDLPIDLMRDYYAERRGRADRGPAVAHRPGRDLQRLADEEGAETGLHLAAELAARNLAFLYLSEPDWAGGEALDDDFRGKLRPA